MDGAAWADLDNRLATSWWNWAMYGISTSKACILRWLHYVSARPRQTAPIKMPARCPKAVLLGRASYRDHFLIQVLAVSMATYRPYVVGVKVTGSEAAPSGSFTASSLYQKLMKHSNWWKVACVLLQWSYRAHAAVSGRRPQSSFCQNIARQKCLL